MKSWECIAFNRLEILILGVWNIYQKIGQIVQTCKKHKWEPICSIDSHFALGI